MSRYNVTFRDGKTETVEADGFDSAPHGVIFYTVTTRASRNPNHGQAVKEKRPFRFVGTIDVRDIAELA